jgi:hypothetical protein
MSEEIQTISADFFDNAREPIRERLVFEKLVGATIMDVSQVKYNPENGEGQDKKPGADGTYRKFKKFYFTVTYKLDVAVKEQDTVYESYGFRFYEDKKEIWYGSKDSACGQLVDILKKSTEALPANPTIGEISIALLGKKVRIISKPFGPSKSMKLIPDVFL